MFEAKIAGKKKGADDYTLSQACGCKYTIFEPLGEDTGYLIVFDKNSILYVSEDGQDIEPIDKSCWTHTRFVESNKKITITFENNA